MWQQRIWNFFFIFKQKMSCCSIFCFVCVCTAGAWQSFANLYSFCVLRSLHKVDLGESLWSINIVCRVFFSPKVIIIYQCTMEFVCTWSDQAFLNTHTVDSPESSKFKFNFNSWQLYFLFLFETSVCTPKNFGNVNMTILIAKNIWYDEEIWAHSAKLFWVPPRLAVEHSSAKKKSCAISTESRERE